MKQKIIDILLANSCEVAIQGSIMIESEKEDWIWSGEFDKVAEEILSMVHKSEDVDRLKNQNKIMFHALQQAESALHLLGGKKKPPTDFIPCEVAAYRIVLNAIKDFQSNK
jgi:hypothetical protein